MRRKFLALWMFVLFIIAAFSKSVILPQAKELYDYYLKNAFLETGATNAITGIYLNYRVFDTIFETILLLISVIGIIYFSRHEGGY